MAVEEYICLCCAEVWSIYGVNEDTVCRNVPPYGLV
jgi:hypothetical protein